MIFFIHRAHDSLFEIPAFCAQWIDKSFSQWKWVLFSKHSSYLFKTESQYELNDK